MFGLVVVLINYVLLKIFDLSIMYGIRIKWWHELEGKLAGTSHDHISDHFHWRSIN